MNPYDPNATCPKCCSTEVRTAHYPAAAHAGCPLYGQNYVIAQNVSSLAWGSVFYGKEHPRKEEFQRHYFERMTADEHFDRTCPRCHFAWVEAVAACPPVGTPDQPGEC